MLKDLTKKGVVPSFEGWVRKLTDKLFNNEGDEKRYKLSHQQMQVLRSLQENKYNIIKGYRCAGLSTMLKLNTLYNLLYKGKAGEYHVLFIYPSVEGKEYAKRMFLKLLNDCEEYLVMTRNTGNQIDLSFDSRNIVIEFITQYSLDNRRGRTEKLDEINIEDAAFIENKGNSDSIAFLAQQTNANVSLGSVPNGEKGLFYETWIDRRAPFKKSSLKWYLDDRFNKDLKGSSGLETYDIDNIGMLFEALENHDIITNGWYEQQKLVLGANISKDIDGEFC